MPTRIIALLIGLPVVALTAAPSQGGADQRATTPSGSAVITGTVVDAGAGRPVVGAIVAIRGGGSRPGPNPEMPQPVRTDAAGRFFFRDLAAGSYTISSTRSGWMPGGYGRERPDGPTRPLDVSDGARRGGLRIPMWRYATISGRVTDETGDPLVGFEVRAVARTWVAGRPRHVFVERAGRTHTDDRGMYRMSDLAPGDYLVVVPAGVTSEPANFSQVVRTAGETPRTYLQTMTAVGTAPRLLTGRAEITTAGRDWRLSSVVALPGTPPADRPWRTYVSTFHPSAAAIDAAVAVTAVSGRDRSGVDIAVPFVATHTVSGELVGPDGPAALRAVHLIPASAAAAPLIDTATAIADGGGAFSFYGVPPGQYIARIVQTQWPTGEGLRLGIAGGTGAVPYIVTFGRPSDGGPLPLPTEPLLYAEEAVTVSDQPVGGVRLTLREGPRIIGDVLWEGTAPRPAPADWRKTQIVVEPARGDEMFAIQYGEMSADGHFATPSLWPGAYLIRVPQPPEGWTLKSATYRGRDVSETAIDVRGDLTGVVITFTDQPPATIDGAIQDPDGEQAESVAVLLFPAAPDAWLDYGQSSRRLQNVTAATGGTFTLTAPPAGEYCLVAVPEAQTVDWRNPAVLTRLAVLAERIQMVDGRPLTRALVLRRLQ